MAQWGRIRQSYMAGKSYKELSEKYGISVKTIQNRASKEGWVKEKGKIKEENPRARRARACARTGKADGRERKPD